MDLTIGYVLGILVAGAAIAFSIIRIDRWDRRRRPKMYPTAAVAVEKANGGATAPALKSMSEAGQWGLVATFIGAVCLLAAAAIGLTQIATGPIAAGAFIPYLMLVGWPLVILGRVLMPKTKV